MIPKLRTSSWCKTHMSIYLETANNPKGAFESMCYLWMLTKLFCIQFGLNKHAMFSQVLLVSNPHFEILLDVDFLSAAPVIMNNMLSSWQTLFLKVILDTVVLFGTSLSMNNVVFIWHILYFEVLLDMDILFVTPLNINNTFCAWWTLVFHRSCLKHYVCNLRSKNNALSTQ